MLKTTLIFLATVAITASQGIEALPPCSLACFVEHVPSTGCGLYDFECSCVKASELTPKLTPCVQSACELEDQGRVVTALHDICSAVGVPIPITGVPEVASSAVDEPIPTVHPEPTSTLYDEPDQTSAGKYVPPHLSLPKSANRARSLANRNPLTYIQRLRSPLRSLRRAAQGHYDRHLDQNAR